MLPSCGCLFFVSHIAESETYRHLDRYGLGCSVMYDANCQDQHIFNRNTSSSTTFTFPRTNKASHDFFWTSQDFILSIEMIIFGILMNLAFSWLDTSVLEAFALSPSVWKTSRKKGDPKHLGGYQEFFEPQKILLAPGVPWILHIFSNKKTHENPFFLCRRREFSLAQGTMTSQRGGCFPMTSLRSRCGVSFR